MKRATLRRRAHAEARAQWALTEIEAIARRGYAASRQFGHLEYLLERAYRLRVPGLPRRGETLERLVALEAPCTARWEQVKAERRRERKRRYNRKGANVDHFEHVLDKAEQQKRAADQVRRAREELGPVRQWAVEQEQIFLKGLAKLAPRMDRALGKLNRLTALLGRPPSAPYALWQQLEQVRNGIPASYRKIVADIDQLTPWLVGQPYYLPRLTQARNCPPGSIATVEDILGRLERSLDEYAEHIAATAPPPPVMAAREPERGPAEVPTETEFEMGGRVMGRR